MKKRMIAVLAIAMGLALTACSSGNNSNDDNTIVIGASPTPHAIILNQVVEDLAEQGITLEIKEFPNWELLNRSLNEGELDANFFQHLPYLEEDNEESGNDLISLGGIHVEPMGAYSDKYVNVDELPDGATIAIPNDATNEGRALLLLEQQGLITLEEGAGLTARPINIADNPKDLKFEEAEAAMLPRVMVDVDMAIINTNYALSANMSPTKDALFMEGKDSPYTNIIAIRAEDKDKAKFKALYEALTTDAIREFIETEFDGEIVSGF